MTWLPSGTVLGELLMEETLVYYDGPRVFTCRSITDQRYLVAWANEQDDGDTWLYVPLSQARLNVLRSGAWPLREAFVLPESIVYRVDLTDSDEDSNSARDVARLISSEDIPEDWLPGENFRLELETATVTPADSPEVLAFKAQQENRTRLRLEIDHADVLRTEAPTRQVGEILVLAQRMYDNFGMSLGSGEVNAKGRIPKEIASRVASDVLALSAASFVIELGSRNFEPLFGDSLFADSTKHLIALLDPNLEREAISEQLRDLGPRAAKSFRKFVSGLADTGADVSVAAASVNFGYTVQAMSSERLGFLKLMLTRLVPDEEVTSIREEMELVAYDSGRRTFGLKGSADDVYEGAVSAVVTRQMPNPTIHARYDALIEATSVLNEVIGETKVTYRLLQLIPASTNANT
ncbi:DUF6575 domain-containing protein [Gordonia sp. NPDC003585]|uniref:DUF6575 domain-containing protein n=1 Tax=Gordonia sp. NPDC003585 TaxID=3154275 RepID=UPI0033A85DF4